MTDQQFTRERLAGYQPELVSKMKVLVGGAGALGQNLIQSLALSGVGEIRIVDFDTFESHNITRSPLYPLSAEAESGGLAKAPAVATKARSLMTAPYPIMRYANGPIQALGDGIFEGVTLVVSAVDNPLARAYLADKARLHGLPLIEGGFDGQQVNYSVWPAQPLETADPAPCWQCSHPVLQGFFSCKDFAQATMAAGFLPSTQACAATLGGMIAEAVIQAVHTPPTERIVRLNIRSGESRISYPSRAPRCFGVHQRLTGTPTLLTTSVEASLANLLEELEQRFSPPVTMCFNHPEGHYRLLSRIVWQMPCPQCGKWMAVQAPEWQVVHAPLCRECGGRWEQMAAPPKLAAIKSYLALYRDSPAEVLAIAGKQAGLAPGGLWEVIDGKNIFHVVRLPGGLEELSTSVNVTD